MSTARGVAVTVRAATEDGTTTELVVVLVAIVVTVLFLLKCIAVVVRFFLKRLFKSKKPPEHTITGRAYVTDGDGIRVSGHNIRIAGVDAPEWNQRAQHQHGYWFKHGKRVKSALIQAIGGRNVRVTVKGYDKYGRVLGTVTCDGQDVGEWLV